MHKYLFILIFLLAPAANANEQSAFDLFKQGLVEHRQNIESTLAFYETPSLYTQQAVEHNLLILDNTELRQAGRDLVAYLQAQHDLYYALPFDQWLSISEELLDLDAWLGSYTAWGNLVVKINICNKVLYRIFDYLENHSDSLNADQFNQLVSLQEKLRNYLPSRLPIAEIALRHYGHLKERKIRPFFFVPELGIKKTQALLKSEMLGYFRDNNKLEQTFGQYVKAEKSIVINDYLDVFDYPLPAHASLYSTKYREFAWTVYLYTKILQKSQLKGIDWRELDDDEILDVFQQEYDNGNKFWVASYNLKFEKPGNQGKSFIIEAIKSKRFLERLVNVIERGKKRQTITDKNDRVFKRFIPNQMP